METNEIKSWLNRGKELTKKIDSLKISLRIAEDRAGIKTGVREKTSNAKKTRGDGCLSVAALYSVELDCQIRKYESVVSEIQKTIDCIEDGNLSTLLLLWYVENKHWYEIAEIMKKTTSYVKGALFDRAIEAVSVYIPKHTADIM